MYSERNVIVPSPVSIDHPVLLGPHEDQLAHGFEEMRVVLAGRNAGGAGAIRPGIEVGADTP
jgi:hypothetical protein